MNKNEADAVIKETIEYANREIIKNKKRNRKKLIIILSLVAIFLIIGFITGERKTEITTTVNADDIQGSSKIFNASDFSNATVTYTNSGAPIVDDISASSELSSPTNSRISAKVICDTWGYRDEALSTKWFVVPKGRVVTVVSNNLNDGIITAEYAGVTIYIHSNYVSLF